MSVQVPGLTGVTAIAAGWLAGYALRRDGSVWAWGNGGPLGDGDTDSSSVPVRVTGLTDVTVIAGGLGAAYALRGDGTVWAWGMGGAGRLGNGSTESSSVPVQVSGLTDATAIAAGGGYYVTPARRRGPPTRCAPTAPSWPGEPASSWATARPRTVPCRCRCPGSPASP